MKIQHFTISILLPLCSLQSSDGFTGTSFRLHLEKIERKPSFTLREAATSSEDVKGEIIDKRPHEQRIKRPRKANRMNHSFMHLYRHDSSLFDDQKIALSSKALTSVRIYLKEYGGFTDDEIDKMSLGFPPLLDLDVKRHLRPKLRFLKHTLKGQVDTDVNQGIQHLSETGKRVPPQYFGSRMEKVIAPRHAFLMYMGLPHGKILLDDDAKLFSEFLISCRRTKAFSALCNQWRQKYGKDHADTVFNNLLSQSDDGGASQDPASMITPKQVDSFDSLFLRGIMAASRDDMDPQNQHLKNVNITTDQMIHLLIRHGSNPLETDVRDISLLHWAAGSGQTKALEQLIDALPGGIEEAVKLSADRDGASILHWAAAGAESKKFGCGGHINVCRFLMENCGGPKVQRKVVNSLTKDGNSVLMWAAWSGTLDVVKLLVRHRADPLQRNRNGCTVAHWGASGGNLEVCKYLHDVLDINFSEPNNAGNTPLSHAVAYGRTDIIHWLKEELKVDEDERAQALAMDYFAWDTIGESDERKQAFNLFSDWDNETSA